MISGHTYINRYRESIQKVAFFEDYWDVLKGVLLEITGRSCGWTMVKKHGQGMIILVIVFTIPALLSAGG